MIVMLLPPPELAPIRLAEPASGASASGVGIAMLIAALVAFALMAPALALLAVRWANQDRSHAAFNALCRRCGLSRRQRRVLIRLASVHGEATPVAMMLSRCAFDLALQLLPPNSATQANRLRAQLFAGGQANAGAADSASGLTILGDAAEADTGS